ncbi:PhoX family phosphatase [Cellulosimicrobium sp. PMB13]|uniref:PhoX family protein n=1 Tax=Cellulosimicrobium sp. PMB13 TaxID=3120158 RepID=UPI003F4C72DA
MTITPAPERRTMLPLAPYARGKRSPVTCRLKCADACSHAAPNASDNEYFRDVAGRALSRRALLGGLAVGAAVVVVGAQTATAPSAQAAVPAHGGWGGGGHGAGKGLSFGPIAPQAAATDAFVVPDGYAWRPIIRWGDPILRGGRAFDPANQSPEQQALQFGYNNDYLDILPYERNRGLWWWGRHKDDGRGTRGLLVTNHEYTNPGVMFDDSYDAATRRAIERAAHGMSVVEVRRRRTGEPWEYVPDSRSNRRVHIGTEFRVDGPAAGTELLKTVADPSGTRVLGTLNNCAGGTTPWGTVLSGEENFHGYFRTAGTGNDARYGLRDAATGYGWELDDPRFDARNAGYENEPNRFGWIVEIDPYAPDEAPVKHTALGRFKHEGANVILSRRGHAVAYMGDDERFDYVYKFVSSRTMRPGNSDGARRHNKTLLSEGSLYVARFVGDSPAGEIDGSGALPSDGAFDGRGEWLPLVVDGRSEVEGMSVEEVLVYTRVAADKVGATKMDRPEDVEPNPVTGRVYVACTNNTSRGPSGTEAATEPNPRNTNRDGHVVEIVEDRDDAAALTFRWNLLLVAGDPATNASTYFAGYPKDKVSPISCPDNLAFDAEGNLWISTDGQPSTIQKCDGLFKVPLSGRERGRVQQFLSVPAGGETCGPVIDSEDRMVYVAVQHPGEDGSFANPQSRFPDYVTPGAPVPPGAFAGPRPAVVQVWKD